MKIKLKFNLHFPKIKFREVKKIWAFEVLATIILLVALLSWDAWIYFTMAEVNKNVESKADRSKVVSLKKVDLDNIDKKLKEYDDFLKNPIFNF